MVISNRFDVVVSSVLVDYIQYVLCSALLFISCQSEQGKQDTEQKAVTNILPHTEMLWSV